MRRIVASIFQVFEIRRRAHKFETEKIAAGTFLAAKMKIWLRMLYGGTRKHLEQRHTQVTRE